ncbi:MAG: hypothetical protein C0498_00135 [Anaerolinea sp.]|nr:hypothetical protein [Anaerolinea sp.]
MRKPMSALIPIGRPVRRGSAPAHRPRARRQVRRPGRLIDPIDLPGCDRADHATQEPRRRNLRSTLAFRVIDLVDRDRVPITGWADTIARWPSPSRT